MKKQIIRSLLVFGFVFGLTAFAQAQVGERYRAHIPFDFSIGKKHYERGSYVLEVRGFDSKYFVVKDGKGRNIYAAAPSPASDAGLGRKAALDFREYGGKRVLEAIRIASLVIKTPKGRISEPHLVENAAPGPVITVALSTRK